MELQITPGSPSRISVSEAASAIVVQQEVAQVTAVAARGPQGPSFAGSNFFDTDAIDALTSSDTGKVLVWNGTKYAPDDQFDAHLTIFGGAF